MCTQFDDADEVTPKGNPKPPTQGILAYMNSAKISEQKKIKIEWLIFCMFICCALPWALMDNKFFAEFILALAPNFSLPDRSAFFPKHIVQEVAVWDEKWNFWREHCTTQFHLTDGVLAKGMKFIQYTQ